MSATQVVEGCFGSGISDGEVCSVSTFSPWKGGGVVGDSQDRRGQPELPIFEGLARFWSCCVHIFHVRGLIFLPHFKIYQMGVRFGGHLFVVFLSHFAWIWSSVFGKFSKPAIGGPFFEMERNPLELACTVWCSIFTAVFVVLPQL